MLLQIAIITMGMVLLGIALLTKSRREKLLHIGEYAEGIVFDLGKDNYLEIGRLDHSGVNDRVIVRFVTKKQEWVTGKIESSFAFFYTGQYKAGDKVRVIYNPDKPSEFVVETGQSETIGRLILSMAGLGLTILGLFKLISYYN